MAGSAQCRGDKYSGELKCRIAAVVIVRGMIWRLFVFFSFRMQAVMLNNVVSSQGLDAGMCNIYKYGLIHRSYIVIYNTLHSIPFV
jgi:hypothetical protein